MTSWQFLSDLLDSNILSSQRDLTYLQLLAIAQHYSEYPHACGTELLDFSWSLGVAASFAFRPTTSDKIGVIYSLHPPEVQELFVGSVTEIELSDFFARPTRQKAVFLRQFNSSVNERGLFDKYYFRQTAMWPGHLGPEFTQRRLLEDPDDPVLRFSRAWAPYAAPKIAELDLRWILEIEYHLLGLGTTPKSEIWCWLDTLQEAIFELSRGQAKQCQTLLSSLQISEIESALMDKPLAEELLMVIELVWSMSLCRHGKWSEAEDRIQRSLSLTRSPETQSLLCNHLGNLYQKAGRLGDALAAYERADGLQPAETVTTFNIANVLKAMGRRVDSLKEFNRIVFEIDNEDPFSWSERANALNNLKEFRLAIDSAERALELDSTLASAWGHKGVALMGLGQFEEAAGAFRQLLQLRAKSEWALFNFCAALYYAGDRDQARDAFRRLKSENPRHPRLGVLADLIGMKG